MLTFPATSSPAAIALVGAFRAKLFTTPQMQRLRPSAIFGPVNLRDEANASLALCH